MLTCLFFLSFFLFLFFCSRSLSVRSANRWCDVMFPSWQPPTQVFFTVVVYLSPSAWRVDYLIATGTLYCFFCCFCCVSLPTWISRKLACSFPGQVPKLSTTRVDGAVAAACCRGLGLSGLERSSRWTQQVGFTSWAQQTSFIFIFCFLLRAFYLLIVLFFFAFFFVALP